MDEATPAGNGIAAQVLLRLGYLLGNADYLDEAERTLRAAWQEINQFPHAHNALLTALEEFLSPTETVVIRGPVESIKEWQDTLANDYAPARMVLAIPENVSSLPDGLANYVAGNGRVLAYVCQDSACHAPASELAELTAMLQRK